KATEATPAAKAFSAIALPTRLAADTLPPLPLSPASLVGKAIAEKALAAGVASVAFDRSGFQYHGRVKALAEAAREAGLQF
ncbi:MAG: hypothetical protein EBY76_02745, partial [Betaproteobacteria bacterium]|nr:hypothetical protein [Betaproteobacteria bacterium]